LTLEPWSPGYDTSLHESAGHNTVPFEDVNLHTELEDWKPVQTKREAIDFDTLYFIDGRRRLEAKVFAQWDVNDVIHTAPGLLGTYAVGLAYVSNLQTQAVIEHAEPNRVLILGGNLAHPGLLIPSSGSRLGELYYRTETIPDFENRGNQLEQKLQHLMRQAEAELARSLKARASLLVVDGTLPPRPAFASSIGYVKTLHDLRLPPFEQRTLFQLQRGQRSPVFEIGGFIPRFSWYLRLDTPVQWHQGLSGVVRLEVYSERGQDWAFAVADWTCQNLPRFAAKGFRDPRAPQQLMPVAFLESELGRRMGDAGIVRRRISAHLRELYAQTPSETVFSDGESTVRNGFDPNLN
jgi:hypothetical protein